MSQFRLHIVVYRYEIIVVLITFLLTGSFAVSSKDSEAHYDTSHRFPYKIALTFDDGPHPEYTQRLVKLLDDKNIKATFFVVGKQVIKHPGLLRLISAKGHQIENHTMTHPNLKKFSETRVEKELLLTSQLIENVTGKKSAYFRPPGGQYNNTVLSVAKKLSLHMVLWTVFPKDHQQENPDTILRLVVEQAGNNGVVILHSGSEATIKALPRIIDMLRSQGYYFVTISQLYNSTPVDMLACIK